MLRRLIISSCLAAALASCGNTGAQGEQGEPGEQGPQGDPGPQGEQGEPGQGVGLGYSGSAVCGACHAEEYAAWTNTGHPYKIVSVDDILAGEAYPQYVQDIHGEEFAVDADFFDEAGADLLTIDEDTFPNDGWDDVTYVIGGYGWKARFIGVDGYIITGSDQGTADKEDDDKVQYNFPLAVDAIGISTYEDVPASSARYHSAEMKPYDCGRCHTTGWVPDTDAATDGDLSDNQDGLEGIHGTWVEAGVGCEGCHGPSEGHSSDPYNVPTVWDAAASCADCHIRTDPYEIDTSGGFIRHHEQFEELIQGKHAALGCTGCHDPHQPVRYGDQYELLDGDKDDPNPDFTNFHGVRVDCASCHFNEAAAYDEWASGDLVLMGAVRCEQCHMPKATKSAVKAGTFHGDTATHLFGINPFVDPISDPELSTTGANPANPYISLDYACATCHEDTAEGTDPINTDFYDWAISALESNGGVHGGFPEP